MARIAGVFMVLALLASSAMAFEVTVQPLDGAGDSGVADTITVVITNEAGQRVAVGQAIGLSEITLAFSGLPADGDRNGQVNFTDFLGLAQVFGKRLPLSIWDIDGNGEINFTDFVALASVFGKSEDDLALEAPEFLFYVSVRTVINGVVDTVTTQVVVPFGGSGVSSPVVETGAVFVQEFYLFAPVFPVDVRVNAGDTVRTAVNDTTFFRGDVTTRNVTTGEYVRLDYGVSIELSVDSLLTAGPNWVVADSLGLFALIATKDTLAVRFFLRAVPPDTTRPFVSFEVSETSIRVVAADVDSSEYDSVDVALAIGESTYILGRFAALDTTLVPDLPKGEYPVGLSVSDEAGNAVEYSAAFMVPNKAPTASLVVRLAKTSIFGVIDSVVVPSHGRYRVEYVESLPDHGFDMLWLVDVRFMDDSADTLVSSITIYNSNQYRILGEGTRFSISPIRVRNLHLDKGGVNTFVVSVRDKEGAATVDTILVYRPADPPPPDPPTIRLVNVTWGGDRSTNASMVIDMYDADGIGPIQVSASSHSLSAHGLGNISHRVTFGASFSVVGSPTNRDVSVRFTDVLGNVTETTLSITQPTSPAPPPPPPPPDDSVAPAVSAATVAGSGSAVAAGGTVTVSPTGTLTFSASVSGTPTPTVTWTRGNHTATGASASITGTAGNPIQSGKLTLTVSNSAGTLTRTWTIVVLVAP